MKIKAIMLALSLSGALLFGENLSLEQSLEKGEKEIDQLEIDPLNPYYIKFLSKNIMHLSKNIMHLSKNIMQMDEIVGLNTNQIIFASKAFRKQDREIKALK
nr:hypothetical protein [Helicobacter pylori]